MDAFPQPTIPKRSDLASGMEIPIMNQFLAIQPSDKVGVPVANLGMCCKGSNKTILSQQAGRIFRQASVRVGERPGTWLVSPEPRRRGFNLCCTRLGIDPIEPGMVAAVPTKVHPACAHFSDLLRIEI